MGERKVGRGAIECTVGLLNYTLEINKGNPLLHVIQGRSSNTNGDKLVKYEGCQFFPGY